MQSKKINKKKLKIMGLLAAAIVQKKSMLFFLLILIYRFYNSNSVTLDVILIVFLPSIH